MHPHTIIATVIGCGVIAVVAFVRPRGEEVTIGDVPRLPREMAAAHRIAGGEGCNSEQRPSTRDDIARHFGTEL